MRLEETPYRLFDTHIGVTNDQLLKLIEEATQGFSEYCASGYSKMTKYNSYLSFEATLRVKVISLLISQPRLQFPTSKVWIPKLLNFKPWLIRADEWNGFDDFIVALRYVSLQNWFCDLPHKTFREQPSDSYHLYPHIRGLRIEEAVARVSQLLLSHKLFGWGSSKRLHASTPSKDFLVVVGQKRKSRNLLKMLRTEKLDYRFFEDVPISAPEKEFRICPGAGTRGLLDSYLRLRDDNLQAIEENIIAWSKNLGAGLLTDHQYDPKIRLMKDHATQRKLPVAFFPEGVTLYNPLLHGLWEPWLQVTSPLVTFVAGNHERDYLATLTPSPTTITTGYFAHKESKKLRAMVRFLRRERKNPKITVLVSLELFYSSLAIFEEYQYQATMILLSTLAASNYRVLVKGRHAHMYALLSRRFPKFKFYNYVPWYVLAYLSDVVIQSDSSLGLEALAIKKPVIVWKPIDYPIASDVYSQIPTDVVKKVTKAEDLDAAIRELVQSQKNDFDKYEYFLAHEHHRVIDWAKRAVSGARAN